MKLTKEAVESLLDTYTDRLITVSREARQDPLYFPGMLIKESKKIWEEIEWARERGWMTTEEAAQTWNELEEKAEELLKDWEEE